MPVKCYTLYTAAAAAANLANVQTLGNGKIVGVLFAMSSGASQGVASEVSTVGARQYATNNVTGIIAIAHHREEASAVSTSSNQFVAVPGIPYKKGDFIYLHATQIGSGGTVTQSVNVYVVED